jgi:hypothetical protein
LAVVAGAIWMRLVLSIPNMSDKILTPRLFVRVARLGSFSKAGQGLGLR